MNVYKKNTTNFIDINGKSCVGLFLKLFAKKTILEVKNTKKFFFKASVPLNKETKYGRTFFYSI